MLIHTASPGTGTALASHASQAGQTLVERVAPWIRGYRELAYDVLVKWRIHDLFHATDIQGPKANLNKISSIPIHPRRELSHMIPETQASNI
jgi:hypothetical protein